MNSKLLEQLKKISREEETLLKSGTPAVTHIESDQESYGPENPGRILTPQQSIGIKIQPRFVAFAEQEHRFMDLVYMASGRTCHTLDGDTELTLETDDLLLIRPGTRHSIQRAEYDDICIHFIILPEFLEYPLNMLEADTILRRFLLGILRHLDTPTSYLHFHLQDMLEAQNLLENMLLTLLNRQRNSQQILQATTGVLFMELLHSTSRITVGAPSGYEQQLVMEAQAYIEKNFRTASLEDFAARTRQPAYYISRLMRRYSPYTFTEYLQRKRLSQAAYLLLATDRPVEVIIYEVGYDNSSYFHKLFKRTYGVTPLQYRKHHSVTAF